MKSHSKGLYESVILFVKYSPALDYIHQKLQQNISLIYLHGFCLTFQIKYCSITQNVQN